MYARNVRMEGMHGGFLAHVCTEVCTERLPTCYDVRNDVLLVVGALETSEAEENRENMIPKPRVDARGMEPRKRKGSVIHRGPPPVPWGQ